VGLATPAVKTPQDTADERPRRKSRAPLLVLASYLLGAIYITARLWPNPAHLVQGGDLHDVDQMAWFMRYSEQAVIHFHLPALVTGAMNAPGSVNLMWNTSLLLPGVIMSPITFLFGSQVSLNILLVVAFAGSAASMYFVLRRWGARISSAALGGALYGFSPAMTGSGIGHYHLVLAIVPPLMIDAILRIVTGRGSAVRNGLWLGLLAAAQLFIGEEALIETVIAAAVLVLVDRLGAGSLTASGLAVASLALLTRGLHLDGLADLADGLGSRKPAEAALAIMKRSDIGPFGVATLVLTLGIQVAALAQAQALGRGVPAVLAATVAGRLALTWACRRGVPAARGSGLGALVAGSVPPAIPVALSAAALAAAYPFGIGVLAGVAAGVAVSLALTALAVRRLGGITGDVLGALVEVATAACLLATAIR